LAEIIEKKPIKIESIDVLTIKEEMSQLIISN